MESLVDVLIKLGYQQPEIRTHLRPILDHLGRVAELDLTPPKGAQDEAAKGLSYRREYGRGGTEVGIARARDISNGKSLSLDTVKRMKAFFDRHEKNRVPPSEKKESDGGPTNGWIAWLLWGGDPARTWAEKVLRQSEAANVKSSSRHVEASWARVKTLLEGISDPLFHATTGPRASSILKEGLKSGQGSNFGQGNVDSLSLSRNLSFLLQGHFGNVIFVFDKAEIQRRFKTHPHQYAGMGDEFEERVLTSHIPSSMIRALIFKFKPMQAEIRYIKEQTSVPIIYQDREGYWHKA
jgi:hypothetical protein